MKIVKFGTITQEGGQIILNGFEFDGEGTFLDAVDLLKDYIVANTDRQSTADFELTDCFDSEDK